MTTHAYLHFQGQCADALAFYADVFGGTDLQIMRYRDAPDVPDAYKDDDRVMHGEITLGEGKLMASDFPKGVDGDLQKAVSVMQSVRDVETGRAIFDRLLAEGDVIQPYEKSFFAPGFGMVRDKFGTHWMIAAMPAG